MPKSLIKFRFIEFDKSRASRGFNAASVSIQREIDNNGLGLWMSRADIEANIKQFGPDPELVAALKAYGG
ncbi:hypothetical protein NGK36_17205 [Hafnia alvei]|uniref:hypothetical protein n=1 Tax=Hafnia alvei TaxID=569 RepID=UPI002DBB7D8A|nr:hypothetical protein [Hafnia alvei]MEB7891010.1 hypothetical protein [Hafnia alvei]